MKKTTYYIVNAITIYRILAAPVLLILLLNDQISLFTIMLVISFFTDFIDGFLARILKVTSIVGARLDSVGDDLTILMALIGMMIYKPEFFHEQKIILGALLLLFIIQIIYSLIKYSKLTSFHTYLAKVAAFGQGVFFISMFLFSETNYLLFYATAIVTALDLLEEIFLVYVVNEWTANVKGIFWLPKRKS